MSVLTVNAGSTSLKLRLVHEDDEVEDVPSFDAVRSAELDAIGHRIVHGGPPRLFRPTAIRQ